MQNFKKTSLTVDEKNYKLFKIICKLNNSDSSKEFRKFIENYIKQNPKYAEIAKEKINT